MSRFSLLPGILVCAPCSVAPQTPEQAAYLGRATPLVLMLDGDDAGRQAMTRHCANALYPKLQAVALPTGLDPADLPEHSLRELLSPLFPH